jgi:hypothetical protein
MLIGKYLLMFLTTLVPFIFLDCLTPKMTVLQSFETSVAALELGYNAISSCDNMSIVSNILWYQLFPHITLFG